MKAPVTLFVLGAFIGLTLSSYGDNAPSKVAPKGNEKSTKTKALGLGAKMIQPKAPLTGMDVYLVGFHPMKDHPELQMEAHHFCKQVNEDFAQCVLFDGNTKDANLNGIEYIISENLFHGLPVEEKKYWHPHNYEILSGQLVGPNLPALAEMELMRKKMNSYGKTWHVWNTGHFGQNDGQKMPMGMPMLAWSFNHDGEARPGLVEKMEEQMKLDTRQKRKDRQELVPLAKPQMGVEDLKAHFKRETKSIPGVVPAQ